MITQYTRLTVFRITVVMLIFTQTACSQTTVKKNASKSSVGFDSIMIDESFDMDQLNDFLWVIEPLIRPLPPSDTIPKKILQAAETGSGELKTVTVPGFRVQLYSSSDYYAAVRVRNEATLRFHEDVYFDFEPPYYRVRIGNFTDRISADELRDAARSLGFPDAWVIQTNVTVTKQ